MKASNLPLNQLMGLIRMLPPELKQTLAELLAEEQRQAGRPGEEEELDLWEDDEDEWDEDEDWEVEEEGEGLERRKLLAAEIFGYSYDHYEDHLGNVRFDRLMPHDVDIVEQAEREGWDDARLAHGLEVDVEQMPKLRHAYRQAVEIVDAPTPAESFRRGVRFSIQNAMAEGLEGEEAIEQLVIQICYRAADLGYLLQVTGEPLWVYSEQLREEDNFTLYSPQSGT